MRYCFLRFPQGKLKALTLSYDDGVRDDIRMAEVLAKPFPFVRVDLYEYKENVFFSELTFTPWGGLMYSYKDEIIKKYGKLLRDVKTDYIINQG